MKKYTQKEFDELPVINGIKQCPTGDYTVITKFGGRCTFGKWCAFSEGCTFGERCTFGKGCTFGGCCTFGEGCTFSERCTFGERCAFGEGCTFCEWCAFSEWCAFGERCTFENDKITNGTYFACDRIGSEKRKTYFFKGNEGFFVRAGCWFGTIEEFEERINEVYGKDNQYFAEYKLALQLARLVLGKGEKE